MGSLTTSLTCRQAVGGQRGFTLLELLIVLVIVGITLGMVTISAMPGERQVLQNEAQRIALLMQLARDEAIVRNKPVAFEASEDGYRFLMREGSKWEPITRDELLRERSFQNGPIGMAITPASAADSNPLRIIFGREPVDKPFMLTLSLGDVSAAVRADGIGNFVVE